jgi:type III restriction enzyme
LPQADAIGTTRSVAFDTAKTVWTTNPERCHLNFVTEDSGWETAVMEKIERMPQVKAYVKNQGLNFKIPYTFEGRPGNYMPDLILKIDDGHGMDNLLHLILEVSGEAKNQKQAKVETTKTMWIPAVNNEKTFGRWDFLEITDPSTCMKTIEKFLKAK